MQIKVIVLAGIVENIELKSTNVASSPYRNWLRVIKQKLLPAAHIRQSVGIARLRVVKQTVSTAVMKTKLRCRMTKQLLTW